MSSSVLGRKGKGKGKGEIRNEKRKGWKERGEERRGEKVGKREERRGGEVRREERRGRVVWTYIIISIVPYIWQILHF
jgi:hypothetical protein